MMTIKMCRQDFRYVPYSNYISYIFKEKPSFEYRDEYNKKNSPYFKYVREVSNTNEMEKP